MTIPDEQATDDASRSLNGGKHPDQLLDRRGIEVPADEKRPEVAMVTIDANDAMTQLPRLLDDVASGVTIVITRHGVPVARLIPPEDQRSVADVIADWVAYREEHNLRLDDLSIREMIEDGRRA
jgi:prevent-host-death family protein